MRTFRIEMVAGDTNSWIHTATVDGAPYDFSGCTLSLDLASAAPPLTATFSSSDGSVVFGNLTTPNDPSSFVAGGATPYHAAKITIVGADQTWPDRLITWQGQWHITDALGDPVTDSVGTVVVLQRI